MNFASFFITRPIFAGVLSVLILIIGVVLSDRWARRHPPERE